MSLNALSHLCSRILRHTALEHHLPIRSDGYVPVAALTPVLQSNLKRAIPVTELEELVAADRRGRFSLEVFDGLLHIRANQGHSGPTGEVVDLFLLCTTPPLTLATLPEVIVHGTYKKFLPLILSSGGLSRQRRSAVHFAKGLPGAEGVISGMRTSAEVLIYLDGPKAIAAGLPIFCSDVSSISLEKAGFRMMSIVYFIPPPSHKFPTITL